MADAFSAAVAAEEGDAGHEVFARAPRKAAAPPSLRQEAWQLTKLAVPTAVANLCEYLPVSFAMWFVGRSRAADAGLDLDAMSLGRSYFNVTCFSVSYGLISAMRTLCPQAVGAGKGKELHGLYAQRALCVVAVGALGGCAAIYFAEPVLVHVLGQKRSLAKLARRYCVGLLPSLAGVSLMTILQRIMTAEGHVVANLAICAAVCATAPAWQYLLIERVFGSYVGAAWASSAYNCTYLLLQVPYLYRCGLGHVFAPRPLRQVLDRKGLRDYLGLALPGLIFTTLEWWSMELVISLGGTRRSSFSVLGALATCLTLQAVFEMGWLGLMVGVAVKVGERVGARDVAAAKRFAALGLALAAFIGAVVAAALVAARHSVARLYARDAAIVGLAERCVPALAALVFADGLNVVVQGALSGAGLPRVIAYANLFGWYVVAAPVACGLVFGLGLDEAAAPTLLYGCALALSASFLVQLRAILRHDWDASVADAQGRLAEASSDDGALDAPLLTS